MHRALPKALDCFNWTGFTGLPVGVLWLSHACFTLSACCYRCWENILVPNRMAVTRNRGNLLTRGGQQQRQKQQVCLLWPALPSQAALLCPLPPTCLVLPAN